MQHTQIDGVPVFVTDVPGPLTAGLVFGVGRKDETFVKGGLTHLVEHLAMGAVGRTALDCNASVDLDTTQFTATGPPGQVAGFLAAVCRALADLPLDRLAVEADVLRTENGGAGPVLGTVLGELHGLGGWGLAGAREPAMRSLTDEDVLGWAGRWFHRGNAALWLTGPVPDGSTLPLPDGPAPARSWPVARSLPTPARSEHPVPGSVGLGAEVGDDPALTATLGILRERVEEELRHRRGVTYTVEVDRIPVGPDRRLAVVVADVREGQESLAAHVLWRQLGSLAADGPADDELARELERTLAFLDDPRTAVGEVAAQATATVLGLPVLSAEELRRRAGEVRAGHVCAAAAAVRDGALLCVPFGTDAAPTELTELPAWSPDVVAGRDFIRRRGGQAPKGSRLVVGDDGVSVVLGEGEQVTVRWADVVGLVRLGPGEWSLASGEGRSLPLVVDDWRDGEQALATVRAVVPAELQVVDDAAADAETGLLLFRAPVFRVSEAVAVSTVDADVVDGGTWTAVRPVGGMPLEVVRAGIAGYLVRRTTTLVLRQDHADVEYVLLRGGTVLDRHRWGAASGDAAVLAEATGAAPDRLRALLAHPGTSREVLAELVAVLGLPGEVPELLAGREVPTARRVRGLGTVAGFRATVRGDHAPPPGTGPFLDRWMALGRTRPAWYRAANAGGALLCALALWLLHTSSWAPDGWAGTTVRVLLVISLLSCLGEVRPPRRRGSAPPAPEPAGDDRPDPVPAGTA